LPGREGLQRRGMTFTNHHINSAVCTSSRSVIYTGQHIQFTKLFDNMDVPWMKDLSHDVPTLGDMLSEAGYYAAYKGKWHLSKELGTHNERALPQEKLTQVIESYGFKDYVGIGDVIGDTRGGYLNDDIIGAQAQHWLRGNGQGVVTLSNCSRVKIAGKKFSCRGCHGLPYAHRFAAKPPQCLSGN
jgi:arylsulfatase